MTTAEKLQVREYVRAAELLKSALSKAASVMAKCPDCNTAEGRQGANSVMNALDHYEPAFEALKAGSVWERGK